MGHMLPPVIDDTERTTAQACPARDRISPCQVPAYCYPASCRHRLDALTTQLELNLNQEEEADAEPSRACDELPAAGEAGP